MKLVAVNGFANYQSLLNGSTLLHTYALNTEISSFLLYHGADICERKEKRIHIIIWANVTYFCLQPNKKVGASGETALHKLVLTYECYGLDSFLLSGADVNSVRCRNSLSGNTFHLVAFINILLII